MPYQVEYTDTFAGEANYCWVRRAKVEANDLMQALRKWRAELGMRGWRGDITMTGGDMIAWKPRGCCTILFVSWDDISNRYEVRHDINGFYICTSAEAEYEDKGNESVGFDGRLHYLNLEAANNAMNAMPA